MNFVNCGWFLLILYFCYFFRIHKYHEGGNWEGCQHILEAFNVTRENQFTSTRIFVINKFNIFKFFTLALFWFNLYDATWCIYYVLDAYYLISWGNVQFLILCVFTRFSYDLSRSVYSRPISLTSWSSKL